MKLVPRSRSTQWFNRIETQEGNIVALNVFRVLRQTAVAAEYTPYKLAYLRRWLNSYTPAKADEIRF